MNDHDHWWLLGIGFSQTIMVIHFDKPLDSWVQHWLDLWQAPQSPTFAAPERRGCHPKYRLSCYQLRAACCPVAASRGSRLVSSAADVSPMKTPTYPDGAIKSADPKLPRAFHWCFLWVDDMFSFPGMTILWTLVLLTPESWILTLTKFATWFSTLKVPEETRTASAMATCFQSVLAKGVF